MFIVFLSYRLHLWQYFSCLAHMKDAIDLLQGHYIVSGSRDMTPPSQKGGIEAVAVSTIWRLVKTLETLFVNFSISYIHYIDCGTVIFPPDNGSTLFLQSFPVAFSLIIAGFFFTIMSLRRGELLAFLIENLVVPHT